MAEGGAIFVDEVGEHPAETHIAVLRVLQEHEFERVGGTGSIRKELGIGSVVSLTGQHSRIAERHRAICNYMRNRESLSR